jgi:hypothetical protein
VSKAAWQTAAPLPVDDSLNVSQVFETHLRKDGLGKTRRRRNDNLA